MKPKVEAQCLEREVGTGTWTGGRGGEEEQAGVPKAVLWLKDPMYAILVKSSCFGREECERDLTPQTLQTVRAHESCLLPQQ